MPLLAKIDSSDPDEILNAFLEYTMECGIELYDHQEEAVLEIFAGRNVILNTPTGSGKSLVAMAMQFQSWCLGRTSWYTVPIKALANEKFLSLCKTFGADSVGLVTGDATVNPDAPIICCTAEILSHLALREGAFAQVDDVIIDEFHYYADRDRGVSWQVPLLTLPQSRFLLMSATFGDPAFFQKEIENLTATETILVQSDDRPVPLEFSYSETRLEEKVAELAEAGKAPIYLVNFTQLACAQISQNLLSTNFCTKEEKKKIGEQLKEAKFNSPYGKEIAKLLRHGIGIHHAGLLPRYRVLVEKLTQQGLLKVICGTDTLGVGVNVPIRTVVFTRLCKYDGESTKILTVRDFKQICGRAGRRGFDDIGYVVALAPEHEIENIKLKAKAATKGKKVVLKKPPERGYVGWEESTWLRLQNSPPEKLNSSFTLQPNMLLHVLSRDGEDGCEAIKSLIANCHEPEARKAALRKRGRQIFRSLVEGNVLSLIPPKDRTDHRKVRVNIELQYDFSLNQALGLWLLDTLPKLDQEDPAYVFQVISLVEAILENPVIVLRKQVDHLKNELMAEMKAEGLEYDDRMEKLDEVEYPKPGADFIYTTFNEFVHQYPWIEKESIRPKSIAREMFENYQSFEDYIKNYNLERSEGVLLRHLSDVYKVLSQTVPDTVKTEEVWEAEEFFGSLLRKVDSSLLDEWEKLRNPDFTDEEDSATEAPQKVPITRNRKNFERMVRRTAMDLAKFFAREQFDNLRETICNSDQWPDPELRKCFDAYHAENEYIRLDPEARAKHHCRIDDSDSNSWLVEQTLVDPEEANEWYLSARVDLPRSADREEVTLDLVTISKFE
ncbi:MAG: DUF3516 domain-containing protein [Verrucomicrobiales bacterium]|nr:DUF3516 domain-containing protein [Verrucomicrobiales bacterium]